MKIQQRDIDQKTYYKIKDIVSELSAKIKSQVRKEADQYVKLQVLPIYDNLMGGYNFEVFITNIVDKELHIDKYAAAKVKKIIKGFDGIKKVAFSKAYNQTAITVFAVGLDPKLLK